MSLDLGHDIGGSLREGFFMFWETLWPLVLGFGLSGAVQAFVPKEQMQRVMGDHRPPAILRATGYGMVSSSCSYAATAMARSLVRKGADFVTALAFMFASTNLVIELGIVLVILMGWQFAAAEFVGGPIMIGLLVLAGTAVFRRMRVIDAVGNGASEHTSKGTWVDAASYAVADLTMLRRELVIGYGVAGFLAVLVPTHAWNDVFVHGHGFWTSLENSVVGPLIAIISFVCSIGNVPLAAALWRGGISFGGVVAFIFADLITFPLLLIYRKYYGTGVALRLLALFWAVMAAAGLIVEGLFSLLGLEPHTRPAHIAATHFSWNYTTILNVLFLGVAGVLYWLYRHRARLGGSEGLALDPICGMLVRKADAPARTMHRGETIYFCSERCRDKFTGSPTNEEDDIMAIDPVCGMSVDPSTAAAIRTHEGHNYFFCNPGCAEAFESDPARYLVDDATKTQEHHR